VPASLKYPTGIGCSRHPALHFRPVSGKIGAGVEEAARCTLGRAPALPLQALDRRKLAA